MHMFPYTDKSKECVRAIVPKDGKSELIYILKTLYNIEEHQVSSFVRFYCLQKRILKQRSMVQGRRSLLYTYTHTNQSYTDLNEKKDKKWVYLRKTWNKR